MKKPEIQSSFLDDQRLAEEIRKRIAKRYKNEAYRRDIMMIKEAKKEMFLSIRTEEMAYLKRKVKLLTSGREGFVGEVLNFALKKFYWLLKNSLEPVFDLQQRFNKFVDKRLTSLEEQDIPEGLDIAAFEKKFRVCNDKIKERILKEQKSFTKYFKSKSKVLDVGCGFGFFLELLEKEGVDAIGVDSDEDVVRKAESKGLHVYKGSAPGFVEQWDDNYFDGISAFHVVEHMKNKDLMEFFVLASKKIKKGGYLIIQTPNIEMLGTFSYSFYIDPTHVRPLHPKMIEFILNSLGFNIVDVVYSSPVSEKHELKHIKGNKVYNENADKLNKLLFGNLDYAVVARRK